MGHDPRDGFKVGSRKQILYKNLCAVEPLYALL